MSEKASKKDKQPMLRPMVSKVVLNIGVGQPGERLDAAMALLKKLTDKKPVQTYSKHKIPAWGLRKGLPIGTKVTLRGQDAKAFLGRALNAVDKVISEKCFDDKGNLTFGIEQYVFFDGIKYDPQIGTMGLQLSATIERPGFRIKRRKIKKSKVGSNHELTKQEAMDFITAEFGVKIENE